MKRKKINLLEEAQMNIRSAIDNIRSALKGTDMERYAESYILGHLENWAFGESSFDETIPKLINKIQEGEI